MTSHKGNGEDRGEMDGGWTATHIEMTKSEFHHFAVGDFVEALVDS